MKTATTLYELAKRLNLSTATVSRALKNHPNIAPETKKRVLQLAKELDYEPNAYAVSLRTSSSKELGIIVPSLTGFFYDSFITAVERLCKKEGYSLLIFVSGDNSEAELSSLKVCKQRKVDGIFISLSTNTTDLDYFEKLNTQGIPVIFVDRVPKENIGYKICFEDEKAAKISADHLVDKGKKKILALFGDNHLSITRQRLKAFMQAFEARGTLDRIHVHHALGVQESSEIVRNILSKDKGYDAIFCMTDEILIGAMKTLQVLGMKTPGDIGIMCMSNGFFPSLYYPEITYVETSGKKLGETALNHMFGILKKEKSENEVKLKSILMEGGSV